MTISGQHHPPIHKLAQTNAEMGGMHHNVRCEQNNVQMRRKDWNIVAINFHKMLPFPHGVYLLVHHLFQMFYCWWPLHRLKCAMQFHGNTFSLKNLVQKCLMVEHKPKILQYTFCFLKMLWCKVYVNISCTAQERSRINRSTRLTFQQNISKVSSIKGACQLHHHLIHLTISHFQRQKSSNPLLQKRTFLLTNRQLRQSIEKPINSLSLCFMK